jgi:hypothetical protein
MVQYLLTIKPVKNDSNQDLKYALDLNIHQENNPEIIFNLEIKKSMIKSLESNGTYKISLSKLEQIIKVWLKDICQGYRETTISVKLPLLIDSQINQVIEFGNQEIPDLIEPDLSSIEPQGGAFPPLNFPV